MQIIEDKEILTEIQQIDSQVEEELNKEKVDKNKVYQLRFQQLMKGIQLTQNPYDILR